MKEIKEGRIAGPFSELPFHNFRVSPLGIIPKKEPNAYRLIHYLSYPYGLSLNDEIDPFFCSVHYSSFDDALLKIQNMGSSALLAKSDIKSAFHLLPIHFSAFNGVLNSKINFILIVVFRWGVHFPAITLICSLHLLIGWFAAGLV